MNSASHFLRTLSCMGLPLLFAMVLHEYARGALLATATRLGAIIPQ